LKKKLKPFTTRKGCEFTTAKAARQKILKGRLHTEEETTVRQEDAIKNKPF
jgi:hypothetical protein